MREGQNGKHETAFEINRLHSFILRASSILLMIHIYLVSQTFSLCRLYITYISKNSLTLKRLWGQFDLPPTVVFLNISFSDFLTFTCHKETNDVKYNTSCQHDNKWCQIYPLQKKLPSKSSRLLELTPTLARMVRMYQGPKVDINLTEF